MEGTEKLEFSGLEPIVRLTVGRIDLMKVECEGGEYGFLTAAPSRALAQIGSIVGEHYPASELFQLELFEHLEASWFRLQVEPDRVLDGMIQGTFFASRSEWGSNPDGE
jgi:hypothetical protein